MPGEFIEEFSLSETTIDYDPPRLSFAPILTTSRQPSIAIYGKNGTGKSTLCHFLAGVIPDVRWARVRSTCSVRTNKRAYSLPEARMHWFVLPQFAHHALLGFSPLHEVMLTASENTGWTKQIIEELSLQAFAEIPSSFLSDGEQRRLSIAIALATHKPMLITDEWQLHLDQQWLQRISGLLENYTVGQKRVHISFNCNNPPSSSQVHVELLGMPKHEEKRSDESRIALESVVAELLKEYLVHDRSAGKATLLLDHTFHLRYRREPMRENVHIDIRQGEIIELTGRNGSGKTTLLRNIWELPRRTFLIGRHRDSAVPPAFFVASNPRYQILGPTVLDELQRSLRASSLTIVNAFADAVGGILGIEKKADVLILSYGQRKFLASIIAIANGTSLILLDEPFSALDNSMRSILRLLIKKGADAGKAFMVAHTEPLLQDLAREICLDA